MRFNEVEFEIRLQQLEEEQNEREDQLNEWDRDQILRSQQWE